MAAGTALASIMSRRFSFLCHFTATCAAYSIRIMSRRPRQQQTGCLLLAVLLAAVALSAAAATLDTTQAGCICLENWVDAWGVNHGGCANPDGDALGAWCAVDTTSCSVPFRQPGRVAGPAAAWDYCSDHFQTSNVGALASQLGSPQQHRRLWSSDKHSSTGPELAAAAAAAGAAMPAGWWHAVAVSSDTKPAQEDARITGVQSQPRQLHVQLRIAGNATALATSPEQLARFKADLLTWLREASGLGAFVTSAGTV